MSETYRILTEEAQTEIEVKRSRFIAVLKNTRTEADARAFLEEIRKANRDARHNCSAMRIGISRQPFERSSDDGEPQGTAGKPMLDLLKGQDLYDVCAVTTRYFGGILLGTGGLVRAYSDALKEALASAKTAELKSGVRVSVTCDYPISNRIRRLGELGGFFPENQVFMEQCTFTYLMPEAAFDGFARNVTEASGGKSQAVQEAKVLYYGMEKPVVYREIP